MSSNDTTKLEFLLTLVLTLSQRFFNVRNYVQKLEVIKIHHGKEYL